jgi:Inner membrane component of T3SS, cytoplasmic domain
MNIKMQLSQNSGLFALYYQGRSYPLNKPQIIIGSDQSCDIQIKNNPQVLPMHAQVRLQDGQVLLLYMGRGAAIWVNGLPVSQQVLRDQDEIAVGDQATKLTLQLNNQPAMESHSFGYAQASQNIPPQNWGQPFSATASQAQAPRISSATDTTRYLCAAGHLDENFQDYVMRHVIYEERRALGESYGVDMPLVVSWCKSGLQRINARDWFLVIFLALVVFSTFLINALINSVLGDVFLFLPFLENILRLFGGGLIFLGIILLPLGYSFEKWVKRRWPSFLPGLITYPILFVLCGPIAVFLVWLTIFVELLIRFYGEPTKHLRKDTFNPQARPVALDQHLENKLHASFSTGQRNVVAYSGYKPFAGAGYYKGGWSFVVDARKGANDTSKLTPSPKRLQPQEFTISSLYTAVERDVLALGLKNVIEIEGKLYTRGQYLPEHKDFFDSMGIRPLTSVAPEVIEDYKEHPTEDVRYYQCLRFNFWRGEMIFTAFLRFVMRGKELFTEIDYLLLPPMQEEYQWIDKKEFTPPISKIWQLYKRSLDAPIKVWFGAPFRLLRGYFYTAEQRKLTRIALNNPAFDYGASTSLRQFASDDQYHLFFQKLDEQMFLKIIEKQILETIINFLDAHQIDTTELRQREQVILNNNTTNNNTINNSGTLGNVTVTQANNVPTQPTQP